MRDAPHIVARVIRPIAKPIVASRNDVVTAWPGHPELSLCVLTADGEKVIRRQYLPERDLYATLLDLFLGGRIRLTAESEQALLSGGLSETPQS